MNRRITLALAGAATGLLCVALLLLDRFPESTVAPVVLLLAGLGVGGLAVARAWARPSAHSSLDGSVAGPT